MTTYIATKTTDLKENDIVRSYGMRLLLGEMNKSHSHDTYNAELGEYVWGGAVYFDCVVLNVEEVNQANYVPKAWRGANGDAWVIQGNDLKLWQKEVA
jgi:hypothetical protein